MDALLWTETASRSGHNVWQDEEVREDAEGEQQKVPEKTNEDVMGGTHWSRSIGYIREITKLATKSLENN